MTAEAGVVVKAAQDAAAAAGCLFPLSFGGEGSATVGGVLSTNAGGNTTVRYGNARDLMLGLEVVLPDGQVWNGLRRAAQGQHRLRAAPPLRRRGGHARLHHRRGAAPVPAAARVGGGVLRRGAARTRRCPCSAASATATRPRCAPSSTCRAPASTSSLRHIAGASLPVETRADHYALVDLASSRPDAGLREVIEAVLEEALEAEEVLDAAIGGSEAQRAALWRIREEHPEAQRAGRRLGEERRLGARSAGRRS